MRTLALCFYGKMPADAALKEKAISRYPNCQCTVFESYDSDSRSKALMNVAFLKRQQEILNYTDFDVCLAIDTEKDLLAHTLIRSIIKPDTLYFTKGYYLTKRGGVTGVSPEIFYADSMTFDRAAEFFIGLQNTDLEWLTSRRVEEIFFYHLKSLAIKTECINRENSDMFIRATSLS